MLEAQLLEPGNRSLLTDLLQPPRGYTLNQAVGTTFTIDLASALTVPLSFTSRTMNLQDNVSIIAALTNYTERITIFAQAGGMTAGVKTDLVALLERVVHPVQPDAGIFHPKVWVLEYVSGDQYSYRFLCLSRNLTEDRSWDLCVRLDGVPAAPSIRGECSEQNQPIVDFLKYLPSITVGTMDAKRSRNVEELAERLSNVTWELPQGVSELAFHFLNGSSPPFPEVPVGEALVISPFVTQGGLETIRNGVANSTHLVSRASTIDQLPNSAFDRRLSTYIFDDVLDEASATEVLSHAASALGSQNSSAEREAPAGLTGLHAKAIFMQERRNHSRAIAFIGSANITDAGLRRNAEMLVELRGHVNDLGPRRVREQLRNILEEYPSQGGQEETPLERSRRGLESSLRQLASGIFHLRVSGTGPYRGHVWASEDVTRLVEEFATEGVTVQWQLYSRPSSPEQRFGISEKEAMVIEDLDLTEITPYLHLSATQSVGTHKVVASTLVRAELHDDLQNRHNAVLASRIGTGDAFMKLLALLLDPDGVAFEIGSDVADSGGGNWSSARSLRGLFEPLMRSLARGDDGLETIHKILTEMRASTKGDLDFPDGFEELWNNVWRARNGSRK